MEIYNEKIYDLLSDIPSSSNQLSNNSQEYAIVEEPEGRGIIIRGLNEIEVRDEETALNYLFSGSLSRTMATHKLNKRSNRSHSIFTIYCQQRFKSGVSEKIKHSKLHLIDLAGSERLKKTMDGVGIGTGNTSASPAFLNAPTDEITKKESMSINRSLSYLEQCIVALSNRKNNTSLSHIPYRQSKLTNILKDCLGTNCYTVMIACIWGEKHHLEETISTLRLASRMKKVENNLNVSSYESIDPYILIKKQEKIINALKQELLMHDALVERTGMIYDIYTPEQEATIGNVIEKYVAANELEDENELTGNIKTFREMLEICKQFKKKLLASRSQVNSLNLEIMALKSGVGTVSMNNQLTSTNPEYIQNDRQGTSQGPGQGLTIDFSNMKAVGQLNPNQTRGFPLGDARNEAAPPLGIEMPNKFPHLNNNNLNMNNNSAGNSLSFGSSSVPLSPDKDQSNYMPGSPGSADYNIQIDPKLLDLYLKSTDGGDVMLKNYQTSFQIYKEHKEKLIELSSKLNSVKNEIDNYTNFLTTKKNSLPQITGNNKKKEQVVDIVDEEEIRITKLLKEKKAQYKQLHSNYTQFNTNFVNQISSNYNMNKKIFYDSYRAFQSGNDVGINYSKKNASSSYFKKNEVGLGGTVLSYGLPSDYENNKNTFNSSINLDELDDQEAFDRLERERIMASDPDSLAFFNAQKTRRANLTQSGNVIRNIQKNKRYG